MFHPENHFFQVNIIFTYLYGLLIKDLNFKLLLCPQGRVNILLLPVLRAIYPALNKNLSSIIIIPKNLTNIYA